VPFIYVLTGPSVSWTVYIYWILKKLKELLDIEIPDKSLNIRPSFSWKKLKKEESRNALYKILNWAINEIKDY
jgi:hypothetical protein